MGFPSKAQIKAALKRMEGKEGTLARVPNPTPLQAFRYELQQLFVGYILDHKMTQQALAEILDIDASKVSKILHNRLDDFSTDRLISLWSKLDPKVKIKVS